MMKIIYVTDVHGDTATYESLFKMAMDKSIKAVFIGGDTCPGFNSIIQKKFLSSYMIPRLRKFSKKAKKPVYIIMGNDDLAANKGIYEKADKEGLCHFVSGKEAKLGNYTVTGYTFINPTPFILKDWEKGEEEIKKDMERLAVRVKGRKLICLFHAPPFGTHLDVLHDGSHVGSIAIAEFIKNAGPCMTFHGHIHESPMMSGVIAEKLGETLSINPGSRVIMAIDIDKADEIEILG